MLDHDTSVLFYVVLKFFAVKICKFIFFLEMFKNLRCRCF